MADLKILIRPDFQGPDKGEGGIRRWVEAQRRHLPQFGITLVGTEGEAEVVACHAADLVNTAKPLVAHCHGLYNTADQEWSKWAWMMNANVIEVLRRATVATVPSTWVAEQVARGMSLRARVLHAAIEPGEWEPGQNKGYILWNKTRQDPVCDPIAVHQLALRNPGLRFVSTFGKPLTNVRITGRLPYGLGKNLIAEAGVYLSTSRETFGIGTLEAMVCAVPVLGWANGGNLDIVRHRETGYLARPGDWDELQAGLEYVFHHRAELGAAAREEALRRFTWERAMGECASIYQEALRGQRERPKVSVIVTVYGLEEYLPDCLRSVQAQTSQDWECLVVDDCSPGDCHSIVMRYAAKDKRIQYLRTPRNLYLAGARNFGIGLAQGRYIIPLDADDMLNERALAVLSDYLDSVPGVAIAYGGMELLEPDGRRWVSQWPGAFSWEGQMNGRNQLPYCSMYRRAVWERTGGYRERCQTSEDNDFWCRATSFGFRAAKVTSYPHLLYRNRPDSMSRLNVWPDCTLWFPWARDRKLTPFASAGKPANDMSWPVKTHAEPTVSVVIPVGPGHEGLVADALDSVLAQTTDDWEAIVVNDTGNPLALPGFPWARVLETPQPGSGPAVARNIGIGAARGEYFVCLDADDYLMPDFLAQCLRAQAERGGYIYTDWFQINKGGDHEVKQAPEFDIMDLLHKGLTFTVTALVPRGAWQEVGGFDPNCGGWEDWDFFFHLATREICGSHLAAPLFCYRYWTGLRREQGYADKEKNSARLREKWRGHTKDGGKRLMGCAGCGKGGGGTTSRQTPVMRQISNQEVNSRQAAQSGMVPLEYTGQSLGTRTYRGARSGQLYRFGADSGHQRRYVYAVDAPALLALQTFREAKPPDEAVKEVAASEPLPVRQAESRLGSNGPAPLVGAKGAGQETPEGPASIPANERGGPKKRVRRAVA